VEFAKNYQNERVKKSIGELRSDLKYLAVLTNGVEIDQNEHREIMDFLRVHYNYLQEINYRNAFLDKSIILFYSV
jgi:hypothetical protein